MAVMTEEQKAKKRESNRKRRVKLKAAGICLRCEWRQAVPGKNICPICRDKLDAPREQLWDEAFKVYGDVCVCCRKPKPRSFVQLHHANHDGAEHKRQIAVKRGIKEAHVTSDDVLRDLREQGWTPGVLVPLCADCHTSETRGRPCPCKEYHEAEKMRMIKELETSAIARLVQTLMRNQSPFETARLAAIETVKLICV